MEQQRPVMVGDAPPTGLRSGVIDIEAAASPAIPLMGVDWYAFVGMPNAVSRKLFGIPPSVLDHLFYALLLQGIGKADVHIFERAAPGDRQGPVQAWQGSTLGTLPGDVVALLSGTNTTTIPAEAIKAVLRAYADYAPLGIVPCPPSPRGAFGHPLKRYAEDPVVEAFVIGV